MASADSIEILRTWASLSMPAPVSWDPVASIVDIAEAEARRLEFRLEELVNESDAKFKAISLREPLLAGVGLNRWLKKEREEAYSDWLAWILEQLQAPDVLGVLGITRIAASSQVPFKVEREYFIPSGGRPDLVLTLGESVMVVIEVKKYSAETADTAKQKGYFEWMRLTRFPQKVPLLLTTDAEEERYEGFSTILWADLCIRLRCLLPALSGGIGLVKAAMFVAFISAVETNLLNLVAPGQSDAVERLFYARTIEHLEHCLKGGTV